MLHQEIAALRLQNQHLTANNLESPEALVSYMGAMQAQDFAMSKWAIASRLTGVTDQMVQQSFDQGKIIRTHLMRPTWHVVAATDIRWMLALTAPQIKSAMRSRSRELGLTEALLEKTYGVMENALKQKHLSREALLAILLQHGIDISDSRSSHLLMHAELDGLICSGPISGNKQTYILLEKWLEPAKSVSRGEAIEKLARKYFTSHGPATLEDFVWWSGLPVREARQGIEAILKDFASEAIDGKNYLVSNGFKIPSMTKGRADLLASFDEYIISYKDRNAVLDKVNHKKAVSVNGIFSPIVVLDGQVAGTWKRTLVKDKVRIEIHPFVSFTSKQSEAIQEKASEYALFLGKCLSA